MHRFFVGQNQIEDGRVRITGPDVNHIRNVLRMRAGDEILAVCDGWEYTCCILPGQGDGMSVLAEITDAWKAGNELPSRITLLQCLPKADKMELVIQKAIELGASRIIPVRSQRCVVRLDARKAAAKTKRWNLIAESAAKQAGRTYIPSVTEPMEFADALALLQREQTDVRLIPYERAENMDATRALLASVQPGNSVAVMIGPEGGFEPREVTAAQEAGFTPVSLGSRILRTETAGLCILSALMLQLDPGR